MPSLLWLFAVIVLSALLLKGIERWEERRIRDFEPTPLPKATVLLVGYDGEEFPGFDGTGSLLRVGCNDALIEMDIPVVAPRLPSALSALSTFEAPDGLHNPMRDKELSFKGVKRTETNYIVSLEGTPLLGGICDTPRLKAQIEETIKLYLDSFEIHLNGSAKEFECLGDESGLCE